jgi:8-oxo-dGTP diphosphatase
MNTFIGCSVIIYDHQGRVLIAQRGRNKRTFPLLWETIGGALEVNESPDECIRREAEEEIGCNLHDLRLFKVYVVREPENQHILIVYTGRIESEIRLNYEIEDVKWITVDDIDNYSFYVDSCKQKLIDFYAVGSIVPN